MSTAMSLVAQGSYISDAAARTITFPCAIDYFIVRNRSLWGTAPTAIVESTWHRGYAAGQATHFTEGGGSAITATATAAGGLGFTEIDFTTAAPGALVASGTAVTNATPMVVTDGVPPAVGNIVRMLNTTAMLQISGLEFEVTAVTPATNYTLGYAVGAGYAAAATNADYRVLPDYRFFPRRRWIMAMTVANPVVISTSVAHGYAVGATITVNNPDANFGMPEINGLTGTVTAVTANTITTNINGAAFTAFAFPTSAIAATGVTHATVTPFGEISTILTEATDNVLMSGLRLDTAIVGANTNVMDWLAFSRDYTI
ncbi:MAG: hypothetical protein ACTSQE_12430 [Candidatus Heimdallarchaeaceae archaeon]